MNICLIFASIFLIIGCSTSDDLDSKLSTGLPLTDVGTDENSFGSDSCSQKCSKEIERLKRNITELYSAFMSLQSQLEHLNKHMSFHEKALKHIAVWGHRRNGHHHNDNPLEEDNRNIAGHNESALNEGQNEDLNRNMRGQSVVNNNNHLHHQHNHHHNHQHHSHSHRPHHSHNQSPPCNQCPHGVQKGDENEETKKKIKDSSEESSEEQESKPTKVKVLPNSELKDNESIPLNDSQTTNPSQSIPNRIYSSKPSVEEQLYFQTMKTDFKEWFTNILNDIHHNNGRVDRSDNGFKVDRRLGQSAIDDMENALNSEDMVFTTCNVKPNRHIALLNQQDVEGTINLWQLKHNRGPLHMHIKLKGFKVSNHEDSHNQHNGHQNSKVRRVRESILMPVEVEPEESTLPMGASHSHGFHVHEFGDLSRDCQSVGSHYNPLNLAHGGPYDVIRHVGDLGNIRCDRNGQIDSEFSYSHISLSGIHSIINRSLVIHSNIDDYGRDPNSPSSAQTGSSGVRIACCLIEEVKQLPKEVDSVSKIGPVSSPVLTSKRRRDTSEPIFVNRNRYEDSDLSEILKKIEKYENDRKYKTSKFK